MVRARLFLFAFLMVSLLQTELHLRSPSAAEYLAAASAALDQYQRDLPEDFGKIPQQPIVSVLIDEINTRYTRQEIFAQSFEQLNAVYSKVTQNVFGAYSGYIFGDDSDWGIAMLNAWLREHPTDLSKVTKLDTPAFYAYIEPHDFNGDGQPEFILPFYFHSFSGYLLLAKDAALPEGYRLLAEHGWSDLSAPAWSEIDYDSGPVEDVTGDGIPEWAVTIQETEPYQGGCYTLSVLTWRGGRMENIFPAPTKRPFCDPMPEFVNLDNDPALEIRFIFQDSNNWGCEAKEISIFDWNGASYILSSKQRTDDDTLGCALQKAEPLMWANQAAEAIPLYEQGFKAGWKAQNSFDSAQKQEMQQYALVRLALAYALVGRKADAERLLNQLRAEQPASEMMSTLIGAMSKVNTGGLAWCTAAYNVFWDYQHSMFSYGLPSKIQVGRTEYVCCMLDNAPPEPELAGCNLPPLLDRRLHSKAFSTRIPVLNQLAERGIQVETSFHADLNGDSREEWLVWPVAEVAPILFVPDGLFYHLSRPSVHRPSQYTQLLTRTLPDGKTALVDWIYLHPNTPNVELYRYDVGYANCTDSPPQSVGVSEGEFRLWLLDGYELKPFLYFPLCTLRTIEDIFRDSGRTLNGWSVWHAMSNSSWDNVYKTALIQWDESSQIYISPPPQIVDPTESYIPSIGYTTDPLTNSAGQLETGALFNTLTQAREVFAKQQYTDAQNILEDALSRRAADAQPIVVYALRYYRALTLEKLGRTQEAANAYAAIVHDAPQSAWGILAAVHLDTT
jgi:tetratricopeptide (TPR) repeat protein